MENNNLDKLEKLINDFLIDNLQNFFYNKGFTKQNNTEFGSSFIKDENKNIFSDLQEIATKKIDLDDISVVTCKFNGELSERTSKKKQYELIRSILDYQRKDAIIFIFYDENKNFRFSFIQRLIGTNQKFTSFKRFTYFVEKNQTNRTFLNQIGNCDFENLNNIKDAFSVQKLNKEFYNEIVTLFYKLIGGQYIKNKKTIQEQAILELPYTKDKNTYQNFAVRLIARTVFCWFLKVKKSEKGLPLLPNYLLSSAAVKNLENSQNYYHYILENLFFEILNTKIENRNTSIPKEKSNEIPFLNGGLFEPQSDDFYKKNQITNLSENLNTLRIPNDWFSEFFKTLESYNFTIDENSANEQEVSIDPEMLGTIFENLLAEVNPDTEKNARKSTGSFYTPREIVDYMIEQSLIQFLITNTSIKEEQRLIDLFNEKNSNFNVPEKKEILDALFNVKILDPACGSGAFPIGALHKITFILQKLDSDANYWKQKQIENIENSLVKDIFKEKLENSNADYIRKIGIIQHCIYGVDIQPIATEISKLRCFLSLMIDEKIEDEKENRGIYPLPNLDFKFITANTLIGLDKKNEYTSTLDFSVTVDLENDLEQIRNSYLQANSEEKSKLKDDFNKIQTQILKKRLENKNDVNNRTIQILEWKPFENESCSWFDTKWMFGLEKFDIIIGNPPYIKEYTNKNLFELLKKSDYYQGKMDLWYFFTCKGLDILKENGNLCFIAPNNWTTNSGASKMRNKIINDSKIEKLLDFGNYMIFETAKIQTMIFVLTKTQNNNNYNFDFRQLKSEKANLNQIIDLLNKNKKENNEFFNPKINKQNSLNQTFSFYNNNKEKILQKIKNNQNFILDAKTEIANGIHSHHDIINKKIYEITKYKFKNGEGIFRLSNEELKILNLNELEKKLIKPYFGTENFKKYYGNSQNIYWIIYTDSKFKNIENIKKYPNIKKHLDRFKEVITSDNKPYGLHRAREESFFIGEKIIVQRKCPKNPIFTYTDFNCYVSATFYVIKSGRINLKYLTSLLNSKLIEFWLKNKGKMQGNNFQLDKEPLLNIPIKNISEESQKPFIELVDKILVLKEENKETEELEKQIDKLVYNLYDLTQEEILIVEAK